MVNRTPKVSVIIPFYNRIDWVHEAVNSVLNQTYRNFELILVDDGSEDEFLLRNENLDHRIRYLRTKNNGRSAARNIGIELATGDYIAFLDSDDLFETNKLERQISLMEDNKDIVLSHTSYQIINEKGDNRMEIRSGLYTGDIYPNKVLEESPIATPSVMVRRCVFDKGLRFNEEIDIAEDSLLWANISKYGPILGIDEVLTKVRHDGRNAATDIDAQIEGKKNMIKYFIKGNPDIKLIVRRKCLSQKHNQIALMFLTKGEIMGFLFHSFKAILIWPFRLSLYRTVFGILYRKLSSRVIIN